MSKEEFLKIRTCVLKVNIHCDGCKHKVKKILQKIDGVYTTNIDSEQGKVTVSGNVDPATLIKKLQKSGKHAELWGAPKANNHQQNQLNSQFKSMQIDNGKGGNNKGQGQKGGNNQPKGGGQQGQIPPQQLQQLKGFQDLKLPPQFKDLKLPFNGKDQNPKSVKFNLPEDGDLSDDEYDDDDFDDDDFDDDELDDELEVAPLNKMKPVMGNGHGGAQMPNVMMNGIMNVQNPQLMKGGNGVGNNGAPAKKGGGGGGGNVPVQVNGNGGKKGGVGNGNSNQNQGGGGAAKNGGKNGGGPPPDGKNGGNKNGNNGNGGGGSANGNYNNNGNGGKMGGGMNDGYQGMPNMMGMKAGANVGQMGGGMPMGQMAQMSQMGQMPMTQMGNIPAVQGLPATAMNGNGGGYFQGAGPDMMARNPYYQQQLASMMMNQQRANGNERFQPMMYARPPPAINYMPPYYSYPQPHATDSYTTFFSDENTSSCSIM